MLITIADKIIMSSLFIFVSVELIQKKRAS